MLIQIIIPRMNCIHTRLTMNYFLFEDLDRLRKKKYAMKIIQHLVDKQAEYLLNKQIEKYIFNMKRIINSTLEEDEDNEQNNNIAYSLITLYKTVIDGKEEWYRNKKLLNDGDELLFVFDSKEGNDKKNDEKDILFHLLIFAFIANRIRTSPLNPINEKVTDIFNINVSQAFIKGTHFLYLLIPIIFDTNINGLILTNNSLNKLTLYQLAISCFLNNNIQHLDISQCQLESSHFVGLLQGLREVEQFQTETKQINITKLNLSKNKSISNNISTIIQKMPNLQTLILNNIHQEEENIACLFNSLEKMYRYKETSLVNLYIVNTKLSGDSIYELTKLLKSYCCKLQLLALSKFENQKSKDDEETNFTNNIIKKLIRNIKYNRSLLELYLIKMNIKEEELLKIIPNTFIRKLYLYKNAIPFKIYGKLIAQTQIDSSLNNLILMKEPTLTELDLSEQTIVKETKGSEVEKLNEKEISLLLNILNKSKLNILDLRGIFVFDEKQDKELNIINSLEHIVNNGLKIFIE